MRRSALRPCASSLHVFKSHAESLAVLNTVAGTHPLWWNETCTRLLERGRNLRPDPHMFEKCTHPVVLVEGLDGVGKTLVTRTLAEKLEGTVICTPPVEWSQVRSLFRSLDEHTSRAFYSITNYMAAEDMAAAAMHSWVIVDRWWCSTCAMALANTCTLATLPPAGDAIYAWPEDLPMFDAGFYLHVDEAIRQARIHGRAPEDAEEKRLSAQAEMRAVAGEAYTRGGLLHAVQNTTYRSTVNKMLDYLQATKGLKHTATPFTEDELRAVTPY